MDCKGISFASSCFSNPSYLFCLGWGGGGGGETVSSSPWRTQYWQAVASATLAFTQNRCLRPLRVQELLIGAFLSIKRITLLSE